MHRSKGACLLLVLLLVGTAARAEERAISRDALVDKISGFWIGQLLGNYIGFPFENRYVEQPVPIFVDRVYTARYSGQPPLQLNYDDRRGHIWIMCDALHGAFTDDDTDVEFVTLHAVEKYGLDIRPDNFIAISDGGGPATVKALLNGTVTAANIFSTSPAIPQNGFVILEDPENNFLPGNVVPLVNAQKMSEDLKTVLDTVSARLTTKGLTELNAAVSGNSGVDPDEAALQWVRENGFDTAIGK